MRCGACSDGTFLGREKERSCDACYPASGPSGRDAHGKNGTHKTTSCLVGRKGAEQTDAQKRRRKRVPGAWGRGRGVMAEGDEVCFGQDENVPELEADDVTQLVNVPDAPGLCPVSGGCPDGTC